MCWIIKKYYPCGKFRFHGYEIDFHACVFRFRLTDILEMNTISLSDKNEFSIIISLSCYRL